MDYSKKGPPPPKKVQTGFTKGGGPPPGAPPRSGVPGRTLGGEESWTAITNIYCILLNFLAQHELRWRVHFLHVAGLQGIISFTMVDLNKVSTERPRWICGITGCGGVEDGVKVGI